VFSFPIPNLEDLHAKRHVVRRFDVGHGRLFAEARERRGDQKTVATAAPQRNVAHSQQSLPGDIDPAYDGVVKMYFTAANLPTPETSFRLFLQSELARRCSRNPHYSLRSFALQLGVDPSTLSQWLRHRRPLTSRAIETIGGHLGISSDRIRAYIDYEMRHAVADGPNPCQLTHETVAAIEDWHSLAMLELTHLDEFRADSRWIAAMLDISVDAVNVALHRLVSLDLLRMQNTRWVDTVPSAGVPLDGLPATVRATLHRQTGDWRERSVQDVPAQERELSSTTVAIRSDALPRAIDLLTKCRRQLLDVLQGGAADDVYQLELSLFPVTTAKRQHATRESES
jgi:hypothetical protein